MKGFLFERYTPKQPKSKFNELLELFKELMIYASGDLEEALRWMVEMDQEFKITDDHYSMGDFIQELAKSGYLTHDETNNVHPSAKLNVALRRKAYNEIFGKINKGTSGNHNTKISGKGDEHTSEIKPFTFGDNLDHISYPDSIRNAQVHHGIDEFRLEYEDLEVHETFAQSSMSSVLLIDISHSMILYGEDRITPAKKVAMALAEYINVQFPKDTLDIVAFGDEAWTVDISDLPYLEVGPYHTNTLAALQMSLDLLKKRKNNNKQVFMITDGKPTCIRKGKKLYKNSSGLDQEIINRTLNEASKFKKLNIPITTFMIARDPYFERFVDKFTRINGGRAFYSSLQGLGDFIFKDYTHSKRKGK